VIRTRPNHSPVLGCQLDGWRHGGHGPAAFEDGVEAETARELPSTLTRSSLVGSMVQSARVSQPWPASPASGRKPARGPRRVHGNLHDEQADGASADTHSVLPGTMCPDRPHGCDGDRFQHGARSMLTSSSRTLRQDSSYTAYSAKPASYEVMDSQKLLLLVRQ